ncbi:MAG TPA: protein-disulfide reductase DsbD N-terminal domain-containing protein [Edaphobacter sp.]|nr:protein-disulfide reductase DsbD N-terminal domain-containing protein [Edaphobacter sp.]
MKPTIAIAVLLLSGMACAQQASLPMPGPKPKQYVSYQTDQQDVKAGKREVVELHFRVADGYHVNSHTPKSELLIPTALKLDPAAAVKASAAEYPAGSLYSFSFNPSEKLEVYTGDFIVKVPVVAQPGAHTVTGILHYQACDKAACYPPKSLPVQIAVTAK